jgi:hypothetical protein
MRRSRVRFSEAAPTVSLLTCTDAPRLGVFPSRTVLRHDAVLHALYADAVQDGLRRANPVAGAAKPPSFGFEAEPLTLGEARRVMAGVSTRSWNRPRTRRTRVCPLPQLR